MSDEEQVDYVPPAPPPVADPAMYHGILGEIVHAADPTTEADPTCDGNGRGS